MAILCCAAKNSLRGTILLSEIYFSPEGQAGAPGMGYIEKDLIFKNKDFKNKHTVHKNMSRVGKKVARLYSLTASLLRFFLCLS